MDIPPYVCRGALDFRHCIAGAVLAVLFTFSPSPAFSEPSSGAPELPPPVTSLKFAEFYPRVLEHYPSLARQGGVVGQARAAKFGAYAALFPRVTGESSVTTTDDPVLVFGSLLREERFTQNNFALSSLNSPRHHTNFNFTLAGELPVFNAFQTIAAIRSSKHRLESEELRKEFVRMEASLVAVESYLRIVLTGDLVAIARQVEAAAREDIRQADELKQKGMIVGADFFAARVTAGAISQQIHRMEAAHKFAQACANILRGIETPAPVAAAGKIPEDIRPPRPVIDWQTEAWGTRKDLAAVKAMLRAVSADVFREKTSILPRVNAFGAVEEDSHNLTSGGGHFLMGFKGTMDLIEPGYWPKKREAEQRYRTLEADERQLKDGIARSVAEQVLNYESLAADLPVAREAMEDARQAAQLTEGLYREGRKSIADLLEMRMAFLAATERMKDLLARIELGHANLVFLAGKLDEDELARIARRMDGVS